MSSPHRPSDGGVAAWWRPDIHTRRRPYLMVREGIRHRVRAWFVSENFIEVETPSLQVSPGWEAHIHPFITDMKEETATRLRYLRYSPEFSMKKLLIAGETQIYQLGRAYRNGDISPLHQPEFTLLEWYRICDCVDLLIEDCQSLIRHCATPDHQNIQRHGCVCDLAAPWRRISVAEAFAQYAGIDILASLSEQGDPDRHHLAREALNSGVTVAQDDAWDDLFYKIFYACIEPHLGIKQPDILTGYPAPLAALAALSPDDPRVSERFEIFIHKIEIANGCTELKDPILHKQRYQREQAIKKARYGFAVPQDSSFLAALQQGLPSCAGVALGFDRLVLLLSGANDLRDVVWEPLIEHPLSDS